MAHFKLPSSEDTFEKAVKTMKLSNIDNVPENNVIKSKVGKELTGCTAEELNLNIYKSHYNLIFKEILEIIEEEEENGLQPIFSDESNFSQQDRLIRNLEAGSVHQNKTGINFMDWHFSKSNESSSKLLNYNDVRNTQECLDVNKNLGSNSNVDKYNHCNLLKQFNSDILDSKTYRKCDLVANEKGKKKFSAHKNLTVKTCTMCSESSGDLFQSKKNTWSDISVKCNCSNPLKIETNILKTNFLKKQRTFSSKNCKNKIHKYSNFSTFNILDQEKSLTPVTKVNPHQRKCVKCLCHLISSHRNDSIKMIHYKSTKNTDIKIRTTSKENQLAPFLKSVNYISCPQKKLHNKTCPNRKEQTVANYNKYLNKAIQINNEEFISFDKDILIKKRQKELKILIDTPCVEKGLPTDVLEAKLVEHYNKSIKKKLNTEMFDNGGKFVTCKQISDKIIKKFCHNTKPSYYERSSLEIVEVTQNDSKRKIFKSHKKCDSIEMVQTNSLYKSDKRRTEVPVIPDGKKEDVVHFHCKQCLEQYSYYDVMSTFDSEYLTSQCCNKSHKGFQKLMTAELKFKFIVEDLSKTIFTYILTGKEAEAFFGYTVHEFWLSNEVRRSVRRSIRNLLRSYKRKILSEFCLSTKNLFGSGPKYLVNISRKYCLMPARRKHL
ncbi:uncharacterized protein LOC142331585 isoform X2 [Lycorma delicatula]|uniref:uncharacterized protein LOC142331585 isoform X2 n=1 Tax=Lycorma delicatula TaxID=130591 RepID=UPI003F50E3E1